MSINAPRELSKTDHEPVHASAGAATAGARPRSVASRPDAGCARSEWSVGAGGADRADVRSPDAREGDTNERHEPRHGTDAPADPPRGDPDDAADTRQPLPAALSRDRHPDRSLHRLGGDGSRLR